MASGNSIIAQISYIRELLDLSHHADRTIFVCVSFLRQEYY